MHAGPNARDHELYGKWASMKNRCSNPNHSGYPWYGAKGVTVCKRWQEDFWAFVEDVGKRPSLRHSLDRIDPFGDYEPGNVRWATSVQQVRNQRKRVKVLGVENARLIRERYADPENEVSLSELAREYGVSQTTMKNLVRGRTYKYVDGPIIEEEEPLGEQPSEDQLVEKESHGISERVVLNIRDQYKDDSATLQELSREHHLGIGTVWSIVFGHSHTDVGGAIVE